MKRIEDCKGARVHAALLDKKGVKTITWKVHYKNESVWCNSEQEVLDAIRKITMVQLFGENFKSWTIGEKGWHNNRQVKENDTKRV